jgi:hypothetical protein
MKYYIYKGTKVFLEKGEYRNNGTLAVLMFKEDGELYGNVTVNLNHPLQSDSMAFLDENNLPGIGKWLTKKKLGINMSVNACSGFCNYPLYMLII